MLDFFYSRDALDLGRYYGDIDGQIRALVAPAQDYEALAVIVDGGSANHEHRMTDRVLRLVAFEEDMRRALRAIGPYFEMVLEECFRNVMRSFGAVGHEMIARSVFGIAGAAARRAIPLSAYYAHREIPARGAGNLAHLVPVLIEAFAHERTTLKIAPWTDRLGLRLQRGQATPDERAWGNAAPEQCETLEKAALRALHRERRGLPMRVRRAGMRLVS